METLIIVVLFSGVALWCFILGYKRYANPSHGLTQPGPPPASSAPVHQQESP